MNFIRKSAPSLFRYLKKPHHPPPPLNRTRSFYSQPHPHPQLNHFRRRGGAGGSHHWYRDPRAVAAVTVVSSAAAVTVYFGNLETVPYTKRTHLILLSPRMERQLGESSFENLKESLRPQILPSIHPDSVRVRLISKEIIGALQRGLRHGDDKRWSELEYSNSNSNPNSDETVFGHEGPEKEGVVFGGGKEEMGWSREDEVLDDRWVTESRKEKKGREPAMRHLEGLNWEVIVVRDKAVNAYCLPGGKIVVNTGLLDKFRTDAEIATVIGHEVGHAIARHAAEGITKNLWLALLQLVILQFVWMPDLINAMSNLLLKLPFSRRMEMEADYIGLLLLASAGYDPRVAPLVYEKLGKIAGTESSLQDYLATHPSSKKRAQLLSQAEVMNEALTIYREAIAGRGVDGFL